MATDVEPAVPRVETPLDFAHLKFEREEDILEALSKVPELRLKPEKIPDAQVGGSPTEDGGLLKTKLSPSNPDYPFLDPIPTQLAKFRIREFSEVDIEWKMLTLDRPKTKLEEEIFSRFIQLDKLRMEASRLECEVVEDLHTKPFVCKRQMDKDGSQDIFRYQTYARVEPKEPEGATADTDEAAQKYIEQMTEMLSNSRLKGDYTDRILKKKMRDDKKRKSKEIVRRTREDKHDPKNVNRVLTLGEESGVGPLTDDHQSKPVLHKERAKTKAKSRSLSKKRKPVANEASLK